LLIPARINFNVKLEMHFTVDDDSDRDPINYNPPQQQNPGIHQPGSNQLLATDIGDNVTLTCDMFQPLNTRWERVDGAPLPRNAYTIKNRLEIVRVEQQNLGQYRCNGIGRDGNVKTYFVKELVLMPLPRIRFYPNIPLTVEAGQNLDVHCQVENVRPEDVHWSTDNNRPLPR